MLRLSEEAVQILKFSLERGMLAPTLHDHPGAIDRDIEAFLHAAAECKQALERLNLGPGRCEHSKLLRLVLSTAFGKFLKFGVGDLPEGLGEDATRCCHDACTRGTERSGNRQTHEK